MQSSIAQLQSSILHLNTVPDLKVKVLCRPVSKLDVLKTFKNTIWMLHKKKPELKRSQ